MPLPIAGYATATFTPAAAAYSANDVISVAQEFNGLSAPLGGIMTIVKTVLQIAHTALIASEAGYVLHLYSVTPPSAHADNAAWDLPSGDRAVYLGEVNLGTPIDVGSTLRIEQNGIQQQIKVPSNVGGGTIWGELVTVGGFTPTAAARTVELFTA